MKKGHYPVDNEVKTTSSGLVAKLTTWQSGLEVRITVVFLSA
jgi:hypothetical protein